MQWARQTGKTEILLNAVGYYIHQDPSPQLVVYPTLASAETFSKDKLAKMVEDTPELRSIVRTPKEKDGGSTVLHRVYPGGAVSISGANSAASLAQRSKRVIVQDEVDRFEANTEGDPCELADGRAEAFHNAVFVKSSTPTIKGFSRIEAAFNRTDQRYWFVPCPKCGQHQILKWGQVRWVEGREEETWYECSSCSARWTDADRIEAVKRGAWRATVPNVKSRRGFHLSGLYSILGRKKSYRTYLHQFVDNFLRAKRKGREGMITWTNTFLAECWDDAGERVDTIEVLKRREGYDTQRLPNGVLMITCGVDVQDDRLECEIVGWGNQQESWGIMYRVLPGQTTQPDVWQDLDEVLAQTWKREDGVELKIAFTGIDSSHSPDHVIQYTKPRQSRHVYAVRGYSRTDQPIFAGISRKNRLMAPVMRIGTDTAKHQIFAFLRLKENGPGFCHFPATEEAGYNANYFNMLTAEEVRTRYVKGFPKREFIKVRDRNEALDARVYATGLLHYANPNWASLEKKLAARAELLKGNPEGTPQATAERPNQPHTVMPRVPGAPTPTGQRPVRTALPRRAGWMKPGRW